MLDSGNSKDYYVIESTLKGNNLIKKEWYKSMLDGNIKADAGSLDLDGIEGLTNVQRSQGDENEMLDRDTM